eukprot:3172704-Prymnesium_polylepis.1
MRCTPGSWLSLAASKAEEGTCGGGGADCGTISPAAVNSTTSSSRPTGVEGATGAAPPHASAALLSAAASPTFAIARSTRSDVLRTTGVGALASVADAARRGAGGRTSKLPAPPSRYEKGAGGAASGSATPSSACVSRDASASKVRVSSRTVSSACARSGSNSCGTNSRDLRSRLKLSGSLARSSRTDLIRPVSAAPEPSGTGASASSSHIRSKLRLPSAASSALYAGVLNVIRKGATIAARSVAVLSAGDVAIMRTHSSTWLAGSSK